MSNWPHTKKAWQRLKKAWKDYSNIRSYGCPNPIVLDGDSFVKGDQEFKDMQLDYLKIAETIKAALVPTPDTLDMEAEIKSILSCCQYDTREDVEKDLRRILGFTVISKEHQTDALAFFQRHYRTIEELLKGIPYSELAKGTYYPKMPVRQVKFLIDFYTKNKKED